MPGSSDFNMSAFANAMGIKNPDWEWRETLQPVVVVGDMQFQTPAHIPASATAGGQIAAIAANFGFFQITSRGPGGIFLNMVAVVGSFSYTIEDLPLAPGLVFPPVIFSNTNPVSVVEGGLTVVPPLTGTRPSVGTFAGWPPSAPYRGAYVPPGKTVIFVNEVINTQVDFSIAWTEIPASEGGD